MMAISLRPDMKASFSRRLTSFWGPCLEGSGEGDRDKGKERGESGRRGCTVKRPYAAGCRPFGGPAPRGEGGRRGRAGVGSVERAVRTGAQCIGRPCTLQVDVFLGALPGERGGWWGQVPPPLSQPSTEWHDSAACQALQPYHMCCAWSWGSTSCAVHVLGAVKEGTHLARSLALLVAEGTLRVLQQGRQGGMLSRCCQVRTACYDACYAEEAICYQSASTGHGTIQEACAAVC